MALDPIWKQQLALVAYGNEYLSKNTSFIPWLKHSTFCEQQLDFRDLNSQHLLAQHFQIWLEYLKKQGVNLISLHSSAVLTDEKNPNPNVELIPYGHFIVSHHPNGKMAWIFGKELAEWYNADNEFDIPTTQKNPLRVETLWRYQLDQKHIKRVEHDLVQPHWDDVHHYLNQELFSHPCAHEFIEPENQDLPYDGLSEQDLKRIHGESLDVQILALLPASSPAPLAHQILHRLDALVQYIQQQIENSKHAPQSNEHHLNLLHFSQKTDDLMARAIIKIANHYGSAKLTPITDPNTPLRSALANDPNKKVGFKNVFALILITALLCLAAYYFGL